MSSNIQVVGDIVVIKVSGDLLGEDAGLDLYNSINVYNTNQSYKKFILDLSEARYINSQGLGVLITSYTHVKNKEGVLVLLNPNESVKKLLNITKLNSVFQIFNSLNEAETALNK
ncbi:MAG: STAS domain-containing protein [Cytophagales bacterium]